MAPDPLDPEEHAALDAKVMSALERVPMGETLGPPYCAVLLTTIACGASIIGTIHPKFIRVDQAFLAVSAHPADPKPR